MKKWIIAVAFVSFGLGFFVCEKKLAFQEKYLLKQIGELIDISNGWQEVAEKRRANVLTLQDMCSDMTELYLNKLQPDPNIIKTPYLVMRDEADQNERKAALWQYAAEHYGGICKWLLDGKPIYGRIIMEANTTLSDCLIVSGSKKASIEVNGASGYITNNTFRVIDMEWLLSLMPVDPNEFDKEVMLIE